MDRRGDTIVDAWLDAWPTLSVEALDAALASVLAPVPALLAGAPARWVRRAAPDPAPAVALYITGLGPWLGWAHQAGRLATDAPGAALLETHLTAAHRRAARMDHEVAPVLDALRTAGIPVTVFKGAATRRYFPAEARSYVDIDILVPPHAIPAIASTLRGMAWHCADDSAAPDRWTWSPTPPAWIPPPTVLDETIPWQLDVHATLDRVLPVAGRLGLGTPSRDGPAWRGHPWVRTLPAPFHFAALAFHATSHHPDLQLVRLVELVLMARAENRPEFWEGVIDTLQTRKAWFAAYPALEHAARLAPEVLPDVFRRAMRARVPPRIQRLVAARPLAHASSLLAPPLARRLQYAATPAQRVWALLELAWPRRGGQWLGLREFVSSRWRLLRWTLAWWRRRGSGRA